MAGLTIEAILAMDAEEVKRRLAAPFEERVPFLRVAAEGGVAEAQAIYAQMLIDGIGVVQDQAAGTGWFYKAAQQGHVMAINMVGRCYDLGWGVPVDKVRAAEWFNAAADRGLDWGLYNYATALTFGQGVPEDRPQALALFRRAAAMGNSKAENYVGSFYEDGWVVERDLEIAAKHYAKSAETGDFRGQFNHARMLAEAGREEEALDWFRKVPETAPPAFMEKARAFLSESPNPTLQKALPLLS